MPHFIEGDTIGSVWIQCIKVVLEHGIPITDDKGMIREVSPLFMHIKQPSTEDAIVEKFGDKSMISFMRRNFEDVSPVAGWGYSYAKRLYGTDDSNQIGKMVQKLQQYPFTKSATISLLNPEADQKHTPCLTTLDFKLRQDSLCLHAFLRSQDVGKKMYADAVALLRLGQTIATKVSTQSVQLYFTICSAHLYEHDIPALQRMVSQSA